MRPRVWVGKDGEDGGGRKSSREGNEETGCFLRARRAEEQVGTHSLDGSSNI